MAASMLIAAGVSAKVTLPNFFTDNMVVQRNSTITIPGTAKPGSTVKVTADWGAQTTARADKDGNFSARLQTPQAGGPYTLIADDGDMPAIMQNVLSGEVWLCSGQSNMEFPVKGWGQVMDADEVVATSNHPEIRLLQIRRNTSFAPLDSAQVNMGGWIEANPASMDFSAVAYFFALEMLEKLDVPIGVIDATWGGTPAESWTPKEFLNGIDGFEQEVATLSKFNDRDKIMTDYHERVQKWYDALPPAPKFDTAKMQTGDIWGAIPVPGAWENSVLPSFNGIVWVQRTLTLPPAAAGKPLTLHTGPIDNEDVTYFNGTQIGAASGWDIPRTYTVPGEYVKAGENVITIKITDFDGEGGICGTPEQLYAEVDGIRYPLAGEWNYTAASDFKDMPPFPVSPDTQHYPTVLFNAMINPLKPLPLRGVIWYQGCNNVGRAEQYEPLFKQLIKGWRNIWGEEMPFYFVQLAGWLQPKLVQPDSEWAELRNSQAKALQLPNTGMAVAIDLGNPADIHPVNKQEVAHRLALLALNRTYGKPHTDAAPVCKSVKTAGNKITLTFDGPVHAKAGIATGFIIGDKDGKFASASARLVGNDTVELSSPLISSPTVARYNWADYPFGNLAGETGLPVAPFATDK